MKYVLLSLLFIAPLHFITAQSNDSTAVAGMSAEDLEARSKTSYRVIPMPSYNQSTEWGISVMAMANYYTSSTDTVTRPSLTAVMGFGTTNGSWGTGVIQSLNLKEDNWRFSGRIMYLSINQELTLGELGKADATRLMQIVGIDGKRQIFKNLFAGVGYSFSGVQYKGRDQQSEDKLDQAGFLNNTRNHGISYSVLYDSRDKIYYPYKGILFIYGLGQNFSSEEDKPNDFLEHNLDLRHYYALNGNTRHMLASHFTGRFLTGNPTNENFSFYGRNGMSTQRGYEVGTYIDKNLVSLEVEYRYESTLMKEKLGFMAFASAGKVFGEFYDYKDAELLPALGGGLRYRILPYERMNIKFDLIYARDGFTFLFGLRETF
ncbi:MAG: hypothetical protein OCD76_24185 [Reichenbachiella sp.]